MRLETGRYQQDDDWPGVFIRGDDAFYYAQQLALLLDGSHQADSIEHQLATNALERLLMLLRSCDVRGGAT